MKTTFKTIVIAILASLTISTLVSCEDANVENAEVVLSGDGPATRAARISNIYLAKGWGRYNVEPCNEQVAEENERILEKAKAHLTASASSQRALVNELLVRDWEYGSRHSQRFDDPNKDADDIIIWAEACMTKLCWGPGYYTKEADEMIAALIESVLDKELGRSMKTCPDASKLKQQALMADCPVTPGRSTSHTQKIYEVLNFDWEAGRELQRIMPDRKYQRHELIIMLSEIPMPTDLRAKAVRWVDGL